MNLWWNRIISIVIAISSWYYIYTEARSTETLIIPVEFMHVPDNLYTDFSYRNQKVLMQVSGEKKSLHKVTTNLINLKLFVNLKKAHSETPKYPVQIQQDPVLETILSQLKIEMKPSSFSIPFEPITEKKVPITLNLEDQQYKDNPVLHIEYQPKEALIRGPESKIKEIQTLLSQKYVIQNRSKSFESTLNFQSILPPIEIITPQKIRFSVQIDDSIQRLTLEKIPVLEVGSLASNLSLLEKNLQLDYITYKGSKTAIQKLKFTELRSYIEVNNIKKEGTYKRKIIPQEFPNLEIVDYHPKILDVELIKTKKTSEEKTSK